MYIRLPTSKNQSFRCRPVCLHLKINFYRCANAYFTDNKNINRTYCEYLHNGQGTEYLIIAGTIFLFIFCVMGIIMGYLSDKFSR